MAAVDKDPRHDGLDRPRRGLRAIAFGLMLAGIFPAMAEMPLDDPMRPPSSRTEPKTASPGDQIGRLTLTYTVVAPDRRIAVIDGRQFRVGDALADGEVVAIEPASVRLRVSGRTYTLHLLSQTIKRPAEDAEGRETNAR